MTDWDTIEIEYAKGIRSNCDLAKQFGISEGAIRKRAKQYGWIKDLSHKITLKAQKKVYEKRIITTGSHGSSKIDKVTEAEIIESEAAVQALALISERESIKRLNTLSERTEFILETYPIDDPEKHAKCTKMIVETREKIFNLYRRNLGINDNANGDANAPVTNVTVNYV